MFFMVFIILNLSKHVVFRITIFVYVFLILFQFKYKEGYYVETIERHLLKYRLLKVKTYIFSCLKNISEKRRNCIIFAL